MKDYINILYIIYSLLLSFTYNVKKGKKLHKYKNFICKCNQNAADSRYGAVILNKRENGKDFESY